MKKILAIILVCISMLGSCKELNHNFSSRDKKKYAGTNIDDDLDMTRKDYYENLYKNKLPKDDVKFEVYDNLQDPLKPILAEPLPPTFKKDRLVTLSVNNDVDVKDILIELARLAEIDIELDPKVTGFIILKVTDKPLTEVIDRVCELAFLRYNIKNNILHVELDSPYVKSYSVDFINLTRSNKNDYNVKVALEGSNSGGSGSGSGSSGSSSSSSGSNIGSGSSVSIKSEQVDDLWDTISKDIKQMIEPAKSASVTISPYVTINKQAGMITVFTSDRIHSQLATYLSKVRQSVSSQALIEAKILEVTLKDEYQAGINWNMLDKSSKLGFDISFSPLGDFTGSSGAVTLGVLNSLVSQEGKRFRPSSTDALIAAVDLVELFGTTRTLSSPRIHAMNNQQAVLSFAQNYVYFKLNISQSTSTTSSSSSSALLSTQVTSDLKTVPIGIILTLQPAIDLETNEITMNIRPTISRIVGTKSDPAVVFAKLQNGITDSSITSDVPVVEVKEMDSVVKVKSGDVMVIGGMMTDNYNSNDSGIPGVKNIPILGNLFKSTGKIKNTVQTVILLKATVIAPGAHYNKNDKDFYNTFGNDPNPFKLKD